DAGLGGREEVFDLLPEALARRTEPPLAGLDLLGEALLVEASEAPGDLGGPFGLLLAGAAREAQPRIGPPPERLQAVSRVPHGGDVQRQLLHAALEVGERSDDHG